MNEKKADQVDAEQKVESRFPTIDDSLDFVYVGLNQIGCTRSDSPNPVIKTKSLGPCIGLVIRDPESTTTTVAHIAGLVGGMHSTNEMIRDVVQCLGAMRRSGLRLEFGDRKRLKVFLIGGYNDEDDRLSAIKKAFEQLGLPKPSLNIRSPRAKTLSFAVDSATGKISLLTNLVADMNSENLHLDMMGNQFKGESGIRITSDPRSLGK